MTTSTLQLRDLAGAAKADRNRAVDAYRALAMLAVALGHWAAIAIGVDDDGALWAGNALEHEPSMAWITWLFQVMPLFFVVGGFASAMSLDRHVSEGRAPQAWVVVRLRRMLVPAGYLAGVWALLSIGGGLAGVGGLVAVGLVAAAIPLWFLANYTIDTALAPIVLPRFRAHPVALPAAGLALFAFVEWLRFQGVPVVPQINWVLGWLLFQVAGFAWRDGRLPTGARMAAIASGLWGAALAAVMLGPWPVAMVHFPGLANSPTHPPSAALLLFGAAYGATAIAVAPLVTSFLASESRGGRRAWNVTVVANGVAMSVYLWHMTAAVAAAGVLWSLGALPTAVVGSSAWWIQKTPLFLLAAVILAGLVAVAAPREQAALFDRRPDSRISWPSVMILAAAISVAVKAWASGSATLAVVGCASSALLAWAIGRDRAARAVASDVCVPEGSVTSFEDEVER